MDVVADTLPPNLITTHTNINCKEPRAVLESVAQSSLEEFLLVNASSVILYAIPGTLVTEGGEFVFMLEIKWVCDKGFSECYC
ncbi:MAG: hypothetical protein IPM86_02865 [Saprospiraceae bacterium]|nr:hypothetical protein [Saprospiraceae bacterium]